MKTKLISLLIALLCMTMLLVSCTDPCVEHIDADNDGICDVEGCEDAVKKPEVAEHEHADANADGVCDTENCGTVIITNIVDNIVEIIVPTKPEEKVPMVVKPIPVANRADYIEYDYAEKQAYFNKLFRTVASSSDYIDGDGGFVVVKKVSETLVAPVEDNLETPDVDEYYAGKFKDTYTVSDISGETELVILTFVKEYEGNNGYVGFDFDSSEFIVVESGKETYLYRAGVANTAPALTFERSKLGGLEIEEYVTYVLYNEKVVVYDNATLAKLEEKAPEFFVDRPEFDVVEGNLGIIYDDYSMQVYDLTKWIECVYTYEVPSSYVENSEVFELANGTYLYQYSVELPDNAVSYDVYNYGYKFDLVYEIVNPTAKTATAVEFGYVIVMQMEEFPGLKTEGKNVFAVLPINNGTLATAENEAKLLITDNELNILFSLEKLVINQDNLGFELVADKYAKVELLLGNNVVDAIVNLETLAVTYLPASIDFTYDTCYMIDDVLYNYDGTVKFDFRDVVDAENPVNDVTYNFASKFNSYFLVAKTTKTADVDETTGEPTGTFTSVTKYYFYDVNTAGAALVEVDYNNIRYENDKIFVVKVETEVPNAETGANDIVVTYNVYNSDGALVTTITDEIFDWNINGYYDEDAGLYILSTQVVDAENGNYSKAYFFGIAAPTAPAA